jgi:alpha-L-fucosidase 2
MGYYEYTQDKAFLSEYYPILHGLAVFFMNCIVEQTERGYEIGYLVGVHESPVKVRNDGTNLAGTIAILRHAAHAADILGCADEFTRKCAVVADELLKVMGALYNGHFFKASDEQDKINMSSIAPIYPMNVIEPTDSRAVSTAQSYINQYEGQLIGHGNGGGGFPWSAGVLGAILAWQHQGDLVWQVIQGTRPTICTFGGMTEVMENDQWNMQYFGTAQGAVCIAIHQMLLQTAGDRIELFPALPASWDTAAFENLLADGLTLSAKWTRSGVDWTARNIADVRLTRQIACGGQSVTVELNPGEEKHVVWAAASSV